MDLETLFILLRRQHGMPVIEIIQPLAHILQSDLMAVTFLLHRCRKWIFDQDMHKPAIVADINPDRATGRRPLTR